jgi:hypothetical protein
MQRYLIWIGLVAGILALGCGTGSGSSSATDTTAAADTKTAGDTKAVADTATAKDSGPDTGPPSSQWNEVSAVAAEGACCVSIANGRIVWEQEGDIWTVDPGGRKPRVLIGDKFVQKAPTLSGDLMVFSDNRNGNFDLYAMDMKTEMVTEVVVADGDQGVPSLDGTLVAFVHRPTGGTSINADIWMVDLSTDEPAMAVTQDMFEQSYPHVHGGKIVWTDFINDPEGTYNALSPTTDNNGDILGFDTVSGEYFEVTTDPKKQLRPAIEGEIVVWLDWRHVDANNPIGVEPEPKYHNFKVYVRNLIGDAGEYVLANGGWKQPELWRRPGVHNGHVAWVTEVEGRQTQTTTVIRIAPVATGQVTEVGLTSGIIQGISFHQGALGWIGAGQVGLKPLDKLLELH